MRPVHLAVEFASPLVLFACGEIEDLLAYYDKLEHVDNMPVEYFGYTWDAAKSTCDACKNTPVAELVDAPASSSGSLESSNLSRGTISPV